MCVFLNVPVGQGRRHTRCRHHAHGATIIGDALVENDRRTVFDHGRFDVTVHQHTTARIPTRTVALGHQSAAHPQTIIAGQADVTPVALQQPGHQMCNLRAPFGTAHTDHRHTTGIPLGEQMCHDRLAHRLRFPAGRFQMHQQARAGIDLDHRASLGPQRLVDGRTHQIHPGDIQADHLDRQHGIGRHFGMHLRGNIGRMVGVTLDEHPLTRGWYRRTIEALAFKRQHDRRAVQRNHIQRKRFVTATTRVRIQLAVDQGLNRADAVTDNAHLFAPASRHHAVTNHQQAVLDARNELFNHHFAAFAISHRPGRLDGLARLQRHRHPPAMVAVGGFDHHRQADVFRHGPGGSRRVGDFARGHGNAAGRNQPFGQILVAGNALGDRAGAVGFGRPDASLTHAVAHLDQVAAGQSHGRDPSRVSGIDNARRTRAKRALVHLHAQTRHRRRHIERRIVNRRLQQRQSHVKTGAANHLGARPESHFVNAALGRHAGLAETLRHAGHAMQLNHDMLENMRGPSPLAQALKKAPSLADTAAVLDQAGQPGDQTLVKARDQIRRRVFQIMNVHPGLDHRTIRPDVRAVEITYTEYLQVSIGHRLKNVRHFGVRRSVARRQHNAAGAYHNDCSARFYGTTDIFFCE